MSSSDHDWPTGPFEHGRQISFDGGYSAETRQCKPDSYRFFTTSAKQIPSIAKGAGLSYTAASFASESTTVETDEFNRILGFDSSSGQVEVEAGISLAKLHAFLSKRGYYLPIQPGHGRITVGGCIAPDVHGKNQYKDGTFIQQVVSLNLFHPNHGFIELKRGKDEALFRLTCGGFGLTGIIVSAVLQPRKIKSGTLVLKAEKVASCEAANKRMAELKNQADLLYSWHDFTGHKKTQQKGYVIHASFTDTEENHIQEVSEKAPPLCAARRGLPIRLTNGLILRAMNFAYQITLAPYLTAKTTSLHETLFPIHGKEFYYRLFGTSGFHEYQALLPNDRFADYLTGLREILSKSGIPVFLASGKYFGGDQDLLRFSGEGICFALNIPRGKKSGALLANIDSLLLDSDGKPNIIKDSRLPREVVEQAFPEYQKFKDLLKQWDPKRLFRSEVSERLGL